METISGVVEKINDASSPAGAPRKWTKKSFLVNDEWYGAFITKENVAQLTPVQEGDAVKITYETKGNYKNLLSIEVVTKQDAQPSTVKADSPAPSHMTPYNVHDKEYRITYLACRRDALEFVKTLVQLDLVSLGTKKADKVDVFYGLVREYAHQFTEDAYIDRQTRAAEDGDGAYKNNKEETDIE